VPIEQGWNLQETFEHLCRKVGLPANTWQENETIFHWYEGLVLHKAD
jgi:AMMECR1 domain-containing protein